MAQQQMMLTSITTYDNVRIVDCIIDEMEMGQFYNSARLVDQVLRDARIMSVVSTRIQALLGQEREIEPAKDTVRGRKIAEDIKDNWKRMFSDAALVELLTWGIFHNSGIAQIVEDTDPWRLEVWHPWALTFDLATGNYWLQTRDGRLDLFAELDGTYRDNKGGRWVLYTPYGYGNTRRGLLRAVHRLYLERQWSHRDRARYSEIFGQPIRFGVAPTSSTEAERAQYAERLSPVGAESVVVGTQGEPGNMWDLKLVEASGRSSTLFNDEIAQLDKEIATLFLGQSQSTDGKGGLSTQENAGETVLLHVVRGDGDTLGDTLHTQFLTPYCDYAYSSGDMASCVSWDIEPAEDSAKKALEFKTLIEGIVAAKTAGLPIDVREVLEQYNVPMVSEAEQAALEAEKAALQPAPIVPPHVNGTPPGAPMNPNQQ